MDRYDLTSIEEFRAVAKRESVIDFKDEGATPDGIPIGKLTLRSSGLPVFPNGCWATLPEARYVAKYFGVELYEY